MPRLFYAPLPGFAPGAAARPGLKHCRHPDFFCSHLPRMSFLTQHPAFWLALAFLALLAANLYVFLTRNWEESLYPVDYARLNYALDVPTIRQWKIEGSQQMRLEVAWNKQPASWQLFIDGQAAQILPGNALSIPLAGAQYPAQPPSRSGNSSTATNSARSPTAPARISILPSWPSPRITTGRAACISPRTSA